jgi:pimeloyl-ACP methyl ester carboxylesterase
VAGLLAAWALGAGTAAAAPAGDTAVKHRTARVEGIDVFYREAGSSDAPTVLLLHGFPTSSSMFRRLIPALADRYHVVAPDYPGFGQSAFPDRAVFAYTFENLARTVDAFTRAIGLERYALYVQDYGAPIGWRLALAHPERVTALVVQNGNAYDEGLSDAWAGIRAYWQEPSEAHRAALRVFLDREALRQQYLGGVPEALHPLIPPDTWTLDWAALSRPGNVDVQLDLFYDYRTNVALYPKLHELFRARRFPTLVAWGRYDPLFTVAGAEAYKRDLPDAELHLLETGHFALETHAEAIAALMRDFLGRRLPVDAAAK